METSSRTRATGDLNGALLEVATKHGRAFVRDSEEEKVEKAAFASKSFEAEGAEAAMEALLTAGDCKAWSRENITEAVQHVYEKSTSYGECVKRMRKIGRWRCNED